MASYAENVSIWWRDDVIMELNNYMQIIFVEVILAVHSILKNKKNSGLCTPSIFVEWHVKQEKVIKLIIERQLEIPQIG